MCPYWNSVIVKKTAIGQVGTFFSRIKLFISTVEPLFRGHPRDRVKCHLNKGVPWREVGLRQLIINQEIQHSKSLLIYLYEIIWWIHKSALRRELVSFLCESFYHCDKGAVRNIDPLCGQSGTFWVIEWRLTPGFGTQKKCAFPLVSLH